MKVSLHVPGQHIEVCPLPGPGQHVEVPLDGLVRVAIGRRRRRGAAGTHKEVAAGSGVLDVCTHGEMRSKDILYHSDSFGWEIAAKPSFFFGRAREGDGGFFVMPGKLGHLRI